MKALGALTLAVGIPIGIAIGVAPPAMAGETEYLGRVEDRLAYLSTDQLLTEGYKVCQYVAEGRATPGAIPFVTKDLAISVSAASEIVTAAAVELDC